MLNTARIEGTKVNLYTLDLTDDEIKSWAEANQNKQILNWTGRNTRLTTTQSVRKWIDEKVNSDNAYFAIGLADSGTFIGICNLNYTLPNSSNVILGIMLKEEFTNSGYGTEAIQLLIQYAFEEMHVHRIVLHMDTDNERAYKAYLKVGFKECGIEHETTFYKGLWHDTRTMEFLETDYLFDCWEDI